MKLSEWKQENLHQLWFTGCKFSRVRENDEKLGEQTGCPRDLERLQSVTGRTPVQVIAEMSTRIHNLSLLVSAITSYIQDDKLVKFQY